MVGRPGKSRTRFRNMMLESNRYFLLLVFVLTWWIGSPEFSFAVGFAPITDSMGFVRKYHSATLLDNGKVLITGGNYSDAAIKSAEIFDPAGNGGAGSFTSAGDMTVARQSHTATKLSDGRVLITGGYSNGTFLKSAEIFDPAGNGGAGTFTPTGDMSVARSEHTATLISGNRVLITGGLTSTVQSSAELFDPAANGNAGGFSAAGSMTTARRLHTATLLGDGRVLITGGSTSPSISSSYITNKAEIYTPDPGSGSFAAISAMKANRREHTATLLKDGKVLVAGGYYSSDYLQSAEVFDPATGSFVFTTASMATGHGNHTATLLPSGKVLVAGGNTGSTTGSSGPTDIAEVFSPTASSFTSSSMVSPRSFHRAIAFSDGTVLLVGGNDPFQASSAAEIYDPSSIGVSPGSFQFYDIIEQNTSFPQDFVVKNTGTANLVLNSMALSGTDNGMFILSMNSSSNTNNCGSLPKSLAAGATCTFSVTFAPTSPGNKSAVLTINSSDPEKPAKTIQLSGKGVGMIEPDMVVVKSHSGNFRQGQPNVQYSLLVQNIGNAESFGVVNVTDLPISGSTKVTAMAGSGWNCQLTSYTCSRGSAPEDVLPIGGSYPPITVTVDVENAAPSTVTNIATVEGGGEFNTTNNSGSDPTTIIQAADMTVRSTHVGSFRQGDTGRTYTLTVTNSGAGPTINSVSVTDTLPVGLVRKAISGDGWTCDLSTLTCTRSDVLAAGASYPPIVLTVDVANNASPTLTNTVSVSGGGELTPSNNSSSDATTIVQAADMTITPPGSTAAFRQGDTGKIYTINVKNQGAGPTVGEVVVTAGIPTGLAATGLSGSGWTCDLPTLSCRRSDLWNGGVTYAIILTVSVAADAPESLSVIASVAGGGEFTTTNNSASYPTTVTKVADLTITKSHTGNFRQGDTGKTYSITVTNSGPGATISAPPVVLTDALPAGLTATAIGGEGWTCNTLTSCTRSDVLAVGASFPPITVTVSVAGDAPATIINTASVSGGGEINSANNSASDTTAIDPAAITVTIDGSGGGTVTSTPAGISCMTGSASGCSAQFPSGTSVQLLATPDWKSLFGGWSGGCSGTGNCYPSGSTVVATFNANNKVSTLTAGTSYSSLQDAYDGAGDNETLLAQLYTFLEKVTFNRAIAVKLVGGKDANYLSTTGFTTIQGGMTIEKGSVDIRDVIIR